MTAKPKTPRPRGATQHVIKRSKDGVQVVASTGYRLTDEDEARFLDTLATTCNVKLSAKAAHISTEALYRRRRKDPDFADRWQAALAQGYARIEAALVQRAADAMEGLAPDPDSPIPVMTVNDALNVLKLHRSSVMGEGRHPGWRARPRRLDEVRASILAKLEAIETLRLAEAAAEE